MGLSGVVICCCTVPNAPLLPLTRVVEFFGAHRLGRSIRPLLGPCRSAHAWVGPGMAVTVESALCVYYYVYTQVQQYTMVYVYTPTRWRLICLHSRLVPAYLLVSVTWATRHEGRNPDRWAPLANMMRGLHALHWSISLYMHAAVEIDAYIFVCIGQLVDACLTCHLSGGRDVINYAWHVA